MEFNIKKNATLPILKVEICKDGRSDFNLNSFLDSDYTFYISLYDKSIDKILFASKSCYVTSEFSQFEGKTLYYLNYQFTNKDTLKTGRYEVQISVTSDNGVIILPLQEKFYVNIVDSFSADNSSFTDAYSMNLPCCGFQETFDIGGLNLEAYYYSGSLIIDYILTSTNTYETDIRVDFTNELEVFTGSTIQITTGVTISAGQNRGTTQVIYSSFDFDNLTQSSILSSVEFTESIQNVILNFESDVIFNTPPPSLTPTRTPTPTVTSTITPTVTVTSTQTPTGSVTPTVTETPTNTPSETPTQTPTESPTTTPTNTPTPTVTETPTNTPTPSVTETVTPTMTETLTPTPTPTITETPQISESPTPTMTETPTNTPTITETPSITPTNTVTPTVTPTSGATPSCPYEVGFFNTTDNVMRFDIYNGNIYVVTTGGTEVYDTSYTYVQTIPNSFTAGTPLYASIVFAEDTSGPSPLNYVFAGGDTNNKSIDVFELNSSTSSLINVGTSITEMSVSRTQDVVGYLMPDSGLYGQFSTASLTLGFTTDVSATTNGDISLSRLDDKFWIVSTGDTIIKMVPGTKNIDSTEQIPFSGFIGFRKTILDDPSNLYTYILIDGRRLLIYDVGGINSQINIDSYSGTNTSMTIDQNNNKLYILNVVGDVFGLIKIDITTLTDEGLFTLGSYAGYTNGEIIYEVNNTEILFSLYPYINRINRVCA